MNLKYPNPERIDVKEDYYGTIVEDPYRYMEDPEDPRTLDFIRKNNVLVDSYIDPQRISYFKKNFVENYQDYSLISLVTKRKDTFYFQKREENQPQPVIYSKKNGVVKQILDLNNLSDDGTTASTAMSLSPDGSIFTVNLSIHGSDWQEMYIKNVETGEVLETLKWIRFTTVAWNKDSSGFYYQGYPDQTTVSPEDKAKYAKVYFHRIGTSQDDDQLVFTPENKTFSASPVMYGGEHLFISSSDSTMPENSLFYRKEGSLDFTPIIEKQNGSSYTVLGVKNDRAFVMTSQDAPNQQIMVLELGSNSLQELIVESEYAITMATTTGEYIAIVYLVDGHHQIKLFDMNGKFVRDIELPTIGSVLQLWGKIGDKDFIYLFESYFHPRVAFNFNHESEEISTLGGISEGNIDEFEIKRVQFESKDGTKIPMYITYKKGLLRDGNSPTYLYGYGGFKISMTPNYQPHFMTWLRLGGIYAVANLRGGGEFGKRWHDQALLEKKQNVFDDFIAAAEYLIEEKYTSPKRLAINGRSNGGLLIGAVMTQRPDLFGASVPQVGVLDMLRYQYFTIGRFWMKEYGNSANPEHFKFLIKYSPLHNIKKGVEYPPTLITAAKGDNRVVPAHSLKFAATLQHTYKNDNPILLRIERKAGHGFGKPLTKFIEDLAYKFAFISQTLDLNLS